VTGGERRESAVAAGNNEQRAPDGYAAIAAPDAGLGLMVPLLPDVLAAGDSLIETARMKAEASRTPNADAGDILAGNAYLALTGDPPDRAAAAACLGALARHIRSSALVAVVRRDGEALDCAMERVDGEGEVRERVAGVLSMAVGDVQPSVVLRVR
jgi:hypothetical protein